MSIVTGIVLFIAGTVIGGGLLFWIYYKVFVSPTKSHQQLPKVAGQEVPQSSFELDFSRSYRIACCFGREFAAESVSLTFFDDARILGFSGPTELAQGDSLFYQQRWVVLEVNGGKRVYMPASSIAYLEEIAADG